MVTPTEDKVEEVKKIIAQYEEGLIANGELWIEIMKPAVIEIEKEYKTIMDELIHDVIIEVVMLILHHKISSVINRAFEELASIPS